MDDIDLRASATIIAKRNGELRACRPACIPYHTIPYHTTITMTLRGGWRCTYNTLYLPTTAPRRCFIQSFLHGRSCCRRWCDAPRRGGLNESWYTRATVSAPERIRLLYYYIDIIRRIAFSGIMPLCATAQCTLLLSTLTVPGGVLYLYVQLVQVDRVSSCQMLRPVWTFENASSFFRRNFFNRSMNILNEKSNNPFFCFYTRSKCVRVCELKLFESEFECFTVLL